MSRNNLDSSANAITENLDHRLGDCKTGNFDIRKRSSFREVLVQKPCGPTYILNLTFKLLHTKFYIKLFQRILWSFEYLTIHSAAFPNWMFLKALPLLLCNVTFILVTAGPCD